MAPDTTRFFPFLLVSPVEERAARAKQRGDRGSAGAAGLRSSKSSLNDAPKAIRYPRDLETRLAFCAELSRETWRTGPQICSKQRLAHPTAA